MRSMLGAVFGEGIHMNMGQTHTQVLKADVEHVEEGKLDPNFFISPRVRIEQGPAMYEKWQKKKDGCTKIVTDP